MDFTDLQDKAYCPYNKNHVVDKEKLIFHLNRCKDKQKVKHKFRTCRYNRIHIVPSQDLEAHQLICPQRQQILQITRRLRNTFAQVEEQKRQRSRQKCKKQQRVQIFKQQIQNNGQRKQRVERNQNQNSQENQEFYFQKCPLCQNIVNRLQTMKKDNISQDLNKKINLAEKLIKKYYKLCEITIK